MKKLILVASIALLTAGTIFAYNNLNTSSCGGTCCASGTCQTECTCTDACTGDNCECGCSCCE